MNNSAAEDTFFHSKKLINVGGKLMDLSSPAIMGILNVTPDSFFDKSRVTTETISEQAESLLLNGADILDLGGQSTRPGSPRISADEEWLRVKIAMKEIRKNFPQAIVSIDTYYSDVARKAVDAGASIINDISGGQMDDRMFDTVAELNVPYILMHMKGTPENMQKDPTYENVLEEVLQYFNQKISVLKAAGVKDILLDPGFGFGKNTDHNFTLLKNLNAISMLGYPVVIGISRKSMINKVLNIKPAMALNGTTVLNTIGLMNGASILRVHDAKEASEVRALVQTYKKAPGSFFNINQGNNP
jgi:dihydropteroate synthase